ncbi:MAG: DUF4160 domain-containing protein [Magnetococcales bacterium]|nr:DUF4160 domain-containing protein [Magnetococcales bacterium]
MRVHVDKVGCSAKFWLAPLQLPSNFGFSSKDLAELGRIIQENRNFLVEIWNGYFGSAGR